MKRKVGIAISCITMASTVAFFQNCSPAQMQFTQDISSLDAEIAPEILPDNPDINLHPVQPEEVFIPAEVEDFQCKTYTVRDLTSAKDVEVLDIPARTAEGHCFAFKILNALGAVNSKSKQLPRDSEVIARDHEASGFVTNHPYVMGKSALNVFLRGKRQIALSGDKAGNEPILADNFILIGVQASGAPMKYDQQYIAHGTLDSSVSKDTPMVIFKNTPVELIGIAPSGTSSIAPVFLENKISLNHAYSVDIRALDAGTTAKLSDIYLIIK